MARPLTLRQRREAAKRAARRNRLVFNLIAFIVYVGPAVALMTAFLVR